MEIRHEILVFEANRINYICTDFVNDDDEGRINFSVALSPKTTRTRNNKLKQCSHVIVVSAMRCS